MRKFLISICLAQYKKSAEQLFVSSQALSKVIKKIENELTEEEKDIVRRARNTQNHHLPKNANPADYMYATAFEGLIGYLYLTKNFKRLKEILQKSL